MEEGGEVYKRMEREKKRRGLVWMVLKGG